MRLTLDIIQAAGHVKILVNDDEIDQEKLVSMATDTANAGELLREIAADGIISELLEEFSYEYL